MQIVVQLPCLLVVLCLGWVVSIRLLQEPWLWAFRCAASALWPTGVLLCIALMVLCSARSWRQAVHPVGSTGSGAVYDSCPSLRGHCPLV